MRPLNISISCLVLLAGFAAISVPTGNGAMAAPSGVCAVKPDGPKYYDSARAAKADGARVMHPGDCVQILCTGVWPKVAMGMGVVPTSAICGLDPLTHQQMTYPNSCAIEYAQATWVHAGPCRR